MILHSIAPKPQHLVVNSPYLSFRPQFVIRTILSTCVDVTALIYKELHQRALAIQENATLKQVRP